MKKTTRLIILGVLIVLVLRLVGKYNTLVKLDQATQTAWSQVENVYQRRADLIPNLVNTVKGAAAQESGVLVAVVNARASATQMKVDVKDAQALAQYQKVQGELSSALGRLLMVTENYPQLQSISAFKDLMTQLEGTENRITVERKNYNDTANAYLTALRFFPGNIVASLFGFEKANLFESKEGSEVAPEVKF